MGLTNWYGEGSIVDAFRGGEVKGTGIDDFLNNVIGDWRREAIKKDVAKGGGSTDAFGDTVSGTNHLFGITDEERIAGQKDLLTTTYGKKVDKYDYSLTDDSGKLRSEAEILDFLGGRKEVKDMLDSSGFSAEELGFNVNTGSKSQLGSLIRTKKEEKAAALREPEIKLAEGKLDLARQTAASDASYKRHQLEVQRIENENARRQRNHELQLQREDNKAKGEMQMQIAMMEQGDRRADREARREDRLALQRQQSIASLIKGLTQLGAGFAI